MTVVETPAERVRQAEEVVRAVLSDDGEHDTSQLIDVVANKVADRAIASLAIWELLDRGELLFTSRSRRSIKTATPRAR